MRAPFRATIAGSCAACRFAPLPVCAFRGMQRGERRDDCIASVILVLRGAYAIDACDREGACN
jgi:hypothetical protein